MESFTNDAHDALGATDGDRSPQVGDRNPLEHTLPPERLATSVGSRINSPSPPVLACTVEESQRARSASPAVSSEVVKTALLHADENLNRPSNEIRTAKYTIYSFVPKFLFEQFRRLSNVYFLIILGINLIPGASQNNPFSAIFPLVFVLLVAAVKDGWEDVKRHQSDQRANQLPSLILQKKRSAASAQLSSSSEQASSRKRRPPQKVEYEFVELPARAIRAGDVMLVHHGEELRADCVLLNTSLGDGVAYIETINLDGESNAKTRRAPQQCIDVLGSREKVVRACCSARSPFVLCDPPRSNLHVFQGALHLPSASSRGKPSVGITVTSAPVEVVPLSVMNFLPRGSVLRNTEWAFCAVVFTGTDTKMMRNLNLKPTKFSVMTGVLNRFNIFLFVVQNIVIFVSCGLAVYYNNYLKKGHWYVDYHLEKTEGVTLFFWRYLTFLVAYSNLIPISLYISLEIVKATQMGWIAMDPLLGIVKKNPVTGVPECVFARPKTSNLNVELSQVKYVFTDKTGTLTENAMKFVGGVVDGEDFHVLHPNEVLLSGLDASTVSARILGDRMMHELGVRDDNHRTPAPTTGEFQPNCKRHAHRVKWIDTEESLAERNHRRIGHGFPTIAEQKMPQHPLQMSIAMRRRLFEAVLDPQAACQKSPVFQYLLTLSLCHTVVPFPVNQSSSSIKDDAAVSKPTRPPDELPSSAGGGHISDPTELQVVHPDDSPQRQIRNSTVNVFHRITYEGQSLDEVALVEAAAHEGFMLTHRSSRHVTVELFGSVAITFDIIAENEFSADRKRMSILLRQRSVKTFSDAFLLKKRVGRGGCQSTLRAAGCGGGDGPLVSDGAAGDTNNGESFTAHIVPNTPKTGPEKDPAFGSPSPLSAITADHRDSSGSASTHHTIVQPFADIDDNAAVCISRLSSFTGHTDETGAAPTWTHTPHGSSAQDENLRVPVSHVDDVLEDFTLIADHLPGSMSIEERTCSDTDRFILLVKGADTQMVSVAHPNSLQSRSTEALLSGLERMSLRGLRTLVFAYRMLTKHEIEAWLPSFTSAQCCLNDRDSALHAAAVDIERDLVLVGGSAVEDKLQDGVPETIKWLLESEIVVWMLTGDKRETAVTIAETTGLVTRGTTPVAHIDLYRRRRGLLDESGVANDSIFSKSSGPLFHDVSPERRTQTPIADGTSPPDIQAALSDDQECEAQILEAQRMCETHPGAVVLVVDGASLQVILQSGELCRLFFSVGRMCRSAVCCRMTPMQKALIVRMFQKQLHDSGSSAKSGSAHRPVALAIGDGANDVSMIQESRVGIGIMGLEGAQAELASDFAIPKFRHLRRLLAVHGRQALYRESLCIFYSIYKTVLCSTVIFCYCFGVGFTGTMVMDSWLLGTYNLIYLSLPPLLLAAADKDIPDELAETHPQLYAPLSRTNMFLCSRTRLRWAFDAVCQGILIYNVALCITQRDALDAVHSTPLEAYGLVTFVMMVIVGNLQAFWAVRWANVVTIGGLLFNTLVLPSGTLVHSSIPMLAGTNSMYHVAIDMWSSKTFWMCAVCASFGYAAVFLWAKGYWLDWWWPVENGPVAMRAAAVAWRIFEVKEKKRLRRRLLQQQQSNSADATVSHAVSGDV